MFSQILTALAVSLAVHAQTIYLAGDSTMAPGGGGGVTDGWGQYVGQFFSIPVVNSAIAGRSARSYTTEGRFSAMLGKVKSGDFVVMEFGHNDVSSGAIDNGREDASGDSLTATSVVKESDGSTQVIHTFNFYMENAAKAFRTKGATVIISSQTPIEKWNADNTSIATPRPVFVQYAAEVAGNTSATYVDHFSYIVQAYNKIGEPTVATYYPMDHTHTTPAGATVVAKAFVRALLCGTSTMKRFLNAAGNSVPSQ
ncbi:unnamed protein product [Mycena citricolor]|uniref:Rhamnogalacturonan acetylesterase n=1 Tax=Mycena citricolor TaxID=2018698 RepID=A0AAD2K7N4_9AGAR|nr:unnamed protein product [Mycena citricolor]